MSDSLIEKSESEIGQLTVPARALWYAAKGNWSRAHELVQNDPSRDAAWIHAHLHRVEGDLGNARYWYHQAGKLPVTSTPLDEELSELIRVLGRDPK